MPTVVHPGQLMGAVFRYAAKRVSMVAKTANVVGGMVLENLVIIVACSQP